jgi:peptidyl-prolyl cis-trans isomerase B (cyclophilin B)
MKSSMKLLALILIGGTIFFTSCGDGHKYVIIETEYGDMKAMLYNTTPLHRDNFVKLTKEKFYDDLLFHRVINEFMIQGGDPESKDAPPEKRLGGGGPGYRIPAEIGSPHLKGTLAAARTGNPEKASSGSQFYIVHGKKQSDQSLAGVEQRQGFTYNEEQKRLYKEIGGAPFLDGEYTVFGEVVEGLEVIDKIAAVKTAPGDRPIEDVKMKIRMARK